MIRKSLKQMKRWGSVAILTSGIALLVGCASSSDPADMYKGESATAIFQKGEAALRDNSYGEAIKRFEALDVQYPYSPSSETAQLHIVYAYYMHGDYASAESAADRFVRTWPANAHIDYVWYVHGLADYFQNLGIFERAFPVDLARRDLTGLQHAWADFAVVAEQYPQSKYAPAARQYMVYLRDIFARHVLEVAQYYYNHGAYVAAANRANEVVREYNGTPMVKPALEIMVKSYQALHLEKDAAAAQKVLDANL